MARPKFIFAASESCADQLFASGFRAPDPFAFLEIDGKTRLLLSDLEVDRGRAEARVHAVDAYADVERQASKKKRRKPSLARVLAHWLRSFDAKSVVVPQDFPLGLARALRREGIRSKPAKGPFWPDRETKNPAQVRLVTGAVHIAEAGMERALDVLRRARIRRDGALYFGTRVLTAEVLRAEISIAIVRAGGEARGDAIVACGLQACDPHNRGNGPLRANELLILDIFPRDARSGYYGDITRTVVRGRATDAQRHLWETCLTGQKLACDALVPGNSGSEVHQRVKEFFAESGYPTRIVDGRWQGFFHGTGHGLGLDIHESPRFSDTTFLPGHVLTVEPGIYVPGLGGVRHEDVALVTRRGHRLLTSVEKPLEI